MEIPKSGREERIKENANVWDFEIEEVDMKKLDDMDEYLVTGNSFQYRDSLFQIGTQLEHLEGLVYNLGPSKNNLAATTTS